MNTHTYGQNGSLHTDTLTRSVSVKEATSHTGKEAASSVHSSRMQFDLINKWPNCVQPFLFLSAHSLSEFICSQDAMLFITYIVCAVVKRICNLQPKRVKPNWSKDSMETQSQGYFILPSITVIHAHFPYQIKNPLQLGNMSCSFLHSSSS